LAVINTESIQKEPQKFVKFASPWTYIKNAFPPPQFVVKGESHVLADHGDREWRNRTTGSFQDHPGAYLKWNLGGRLLTMWSFHNAYNGDVYIYPMKRRGFQENRLLKSIHLVMRALHWPLFLLALAAPILLLVRWWRRTLPVDYRLLLIPALGFVYFLGVLSFLHWLPRYTIPVRPISYVLAAATLSWLSAYASGIHGRSDA
jgi:hypothetical protein